MERKRRAWHISINVIREYNFNIHAPKRRNEENGQQPPQRNNAELRETLIYFEKKKKKKRIEKKTPHLNGSCDVSISLVSI
jgi:hypothetical protein